MESRFKWRMVYCLTELCFVDEEKIALSSANKDSSVLFALGMSFKKTLNKKGDITQPCASPSNGVLAFQNLSKIFPSNELLLIRDFMIFIREIGKF